jgi:CMP-N-acetylneuraminic acid synthetase
MRPSSLAQDDTPMLAVIQHALETLAADGWTTDVVVLLQPTSPLRRPSHVRDAVTKLHETKADSVVTVVELPATSVAGLRHADRRRRAASVPC